MVRQAMAEPAPVDPAVQSIRVAAALHERFGELLRSPRLEQSIAELELRIGEAQQLYPEIWRHLDDARATLAGRGVNVAAFDEIRASEPRGSLGVVDVDVKQDVSIGFGGVELSESKSATFNLAGYARARGALAAIKAAMPEIDWAALARAEAQELAAIGSLTFWTPPKLVALAAVSLIVLYLIVR